MLRLWDPVASMQMKRKAIMLLLADSLLLPVGVDPECAVGVKTRTVHWLKCTGRGSHLGGNIKRNVPLARCGQEQGKFENGSGKEKSSLRKV